MMRLATFDFYAPSSLLEALDILARGNGDTKILAGGTDLIVGMKQGVSLPKRVVWLGKLKELQRMTFSPERGLCIGAMCTLDEIERNRDVQRFFPSLIQAIRSIASPQIRNLATIGGNLCLNTRCFYYDQSEFWRASLGYCLKHGDGICHAAPELKTCAAVFPSDLAPILIALSATVTLNAVDSQRTIPLSDLYLSDGKSHLAMKSGEILSSIATPYDPSVKASHMKYRLRNSFDFPLVNVGIAISFTDRSLCSRASIVIGAVASAPIVVTRASGNILDKELSAELIETVGEQIPSYVQPLPNIDTSVALRKKMATVLVKRTLKRLATENTHVRV